jgi:ribosomal protein S18 acetylase RimI-like enzyme
MTEVGLAVRPATRADAAAIHAFTNAVHEAEIGEPSTTLAEIEGVFDSPTERAGVVEGAAGELLGWADIDYEKGHEKCWGDIVVAPDGDLDVARALVGWLRETAHELAPGLPSHVFCDSSNELKRQVYAEAGGAVVRRFYRMGIDFADEQRFELPELGGNVAIRTISHTDDELRVMHRVVDTAFLDHFGHESEEFEVWRPRAAGAECPDPTLWWLATVDGEPAAGLYASVLPTAGYVDTLGTLREFRGHGLGRALLLTSFAEFHSRGLRRVVLGVDATNPTGALGLYESVGMRAEHQGLRHELPPLATG